MVQDIIELIEISSDGKLIVKPKLSSFPMIYRSASEVRWDLKNNYLYSPKPKEWKYIDWFINIIKTVNDSSVDLKISNSTQWKNIPLDLKIQIESYFK